MKRILLCTIFVLMLFSSRLSFAFSSFQNHEQLQSFITGYNLSPSPEKVSGMMDYAVTNNLLLEPSSRYSIVSFLVGVMERNKGQPWAESWKRKIESYGDVYSSVLGIALRYDPDGFLQGIPESTIYVDAVWGLYFATGQEKYLSMLMNTAAAEPQREINQGLAVYSARVSLSSHAGYISSVNEFLESEKIFGIARNREFAAMLQKGNSEAIMENARSYLSQIMINKGLKTVLSNLCLCMII